MIIKLNIIYLMRMNYALGSTYEVSCEKEEENEATS